MAIPCYVSGKGMYATERTRQFKVTVIEQLEATGIGYDTRYRYYQRQFPTMAPPALPSPLPPNPSPRERAHRAGLQQGLHNEGFLDEKTVDGQNVYDLLFKFLDPKLVKFQYQVSSIEWGFHAVHYFRKYPGRFISMHAQGWDAKTRKIVAIGQGTLNWKQIFEAAKVGGIKNYFVEVPLPLMKASMPYLHKLQV